MNYWEWESSPTVTPLEGGRGLGERAGEIGIGYFPGAGFYPACSRHGAMNCVKKGEDFKAADSLWRCLVEGCNIGAEYAGIDALNASWGDY